MAVQCVLTGVLSVITRLVMAVHNISLNANQSVIQHIMPQSYRICPRTPEESGAFALGGGGF
jgi:hypothetical protein